MDIKVVIVEKTSGSTERMYDSVTPEIITVHHAPVYAVVDWRSGEEIASFSGYHGKLAAQTYIHSQPAWVIMDVPERALSKHSQPFDAERQFASTHPLIRERVERMAS